MKDYQTETFWSHCEGVAVHGPLKGTILQQIPSYQCTWEEWHALHPESEVLPWPDNPLHRDGRHGHGSDEHLGTPGVGTGFGPSFVNTLSGPIDTRLPEDVPILGVNTATGVKAYPLWEVQRSGCVVNDSIGSEPVVIFLHSPSSHMMAAYSSRLGPRVLKFKARDGGFVDLQTGSQWSIEGTASTGPLRGEVLEPLSFAFLKWHVWALYHPNTELYVSGLDEPRGITVGDFQPLIRLLKNAGYGVRLQNEIPRILLPQRARRGFILRINNDRMRAYQFETATDAEDFCYIEPHALEVGQFVFQSDPDVQFADVYQMERLPDEEIAWSELLADPRFQKAIATPIQASQAPPGAGFKLILEGLPKLGFEVAAPAFVPLDSLPVEATSGIWATIQGDRFLIYHYESEAACEHYCEMTGHCVAAGRFAFRSDPHNQYRFPQFGTGNKPDEKVDWSPLLGDAAFRTAIGEVTRSGDTAPQARSLRGD